MNVKTKEIYSEVYEVLNLLGTEYLDKLPSSLLTMIKDKRQVNYIPQYTDDIPLNKQNIKKETLSIIALLYLNYWCKNENEKLEVQQMLKSNEDKYQAELKEKYNTDNIFKNHNKVECNIETKTSMVPYEESIFKKIINKIKSIFDKKRHL